MSTTPEPWPQLARFRVQSLLGGGGQGAVYEAFDVERQAPVALKVVGARRPDQILRFKNEFRALRDLRHPNLVTLGELIEEEGRWFFTMELVRGRDFLSWVRLDRAPLPPPSGSTEIDTIQLKREQSDPSSSSPVVVQNGSAAFDELRLRRALADLTTALDFVHQAGKVHRDLKPSNVIVDERGRLVLIDFGIVAELGDQDADRGLVLGTTPYMSPEQARGEAVGPAADWYAVGVMLFEALTGRRPFNGKPEDLVDFKCKFDAPLPGTLVPGLPADLEQLTTRLLSRDPALRPGPREILAVVGANPPSSDGGSGLRMAFVGRERELEQLETAYRQMRAGQSVAVFISGESGIGKSLLARRFVERLRATDERLLLLRGRCHEQERVSYNAFDSVIDGVARQLQSRPLPLPLGMAALTKLFPSLRAVSPDASIEVQPAKALRSERAEAFEALRELLRRLASTRPLVVLVDDVQWADGDSLSLLEEITREPNAPLLLLVCTARGDGQAAAKHARSAVVHQLELAPLQPEDAERLARAALAREGVSESAARTIVDEARGHPMFIDELVRHAAHRRAGSAAGLDDALRTRVAELPPPAQRLIALVAAAGVPVTREVLADASELPPALFADELAQLRDRRLLRIAGSRRGDTVEPYHDRVREAVYAGLSAGERQSLHRRLAEALTAGNAGPELLYTQWRAAGQHERALPHAVAAAHAASAALAFGRAVELWRAALELAGDGAEARALRIGLADALQNDGRAAEAADQFLAAAELARGDAEQSLELRRRAVEQWLMSGDLERGLASAEPVLRAVKLKPPKSMLPMLARVGYNQLRLRRRPLEWQKRAAGELERHALERLDVCWSMGAGLAMVDLMQSAYFSTEGALASLQLGEPLRICRALVSASFSAAAMGRREQAQALVDGARRAAEQHGSDLARFYAALAQYAYAYIADQSFTACLDGQPELDRLWRSAGRGPGWETDVIEHFCCAALFFDGRYADARDRTLTRIREARRTGNRFSELTFRVRFYHPHLVDDDPEGGRREVEAALAAWPQNVSFGNQHLWALSSLTRLALYRGDVQAQAPRLEALFDGCRRSLIGRLPIFRLQWWFDASSWHLARALAFRREGDEAAARRHLARAEAYARKLIELEHMPLAPLLGRVTKAGVAHAHGDDRIAALELKSTLDGLRARFNCLAPVVQRRIGQALGGTEGHAVVAAADQLQHRLGIRQPALVADSFLPW